MQEIDFDIHFQVRGRAVPPDGIESQRCTVCGARLSLHQPDPDDPQRLLAHCTHPDCSIWFALIMTPGGQVAYLIRLPSVAEMREAIARWRGSDGHAGGAGG